MRWPISNFKYSLIILATFGLLSCGADSKYEEFGATLNRILNVEKEEVATVFLIPGEGCGGCISDATSYVFGRIEEKNISVVFTGVEDRKLLALQLGDEFLTRNNVYLDSENLFMHQDLVSIYPRILKLQKGKVTDITDFDPGYLAGN